ncbi:capsule biosynthesis protein [Yoonia sp. SDW83-1]|uniref:capsule biosynthesis protein n=1 Tax=Yoonia sp. SDW83-1 TaxID=3366945 RepID=UPI00398C7825
MTQTPRHFLFLQGPHGPFFARLGRMLQATGAKVWRVGFNAGDQAFWRGSGYIPYLGRPEDWPDTLSALIAEHQITDLVLYGDIRPIHAAAVRIARAAGLRIHVFEEGYLRPYWVTYERGGSNGHSRLMDMSVPDMAAALAASDHDMHPPPAVWGDMRQHVFYGALYHWFVLFRNQRYRHFTRHRSLPVGREAVLYTKRLLLMPFAALSRRVAQMRIRFGGFPYHLVLLQLEHDASFQAHSPFARMEEFLQLVIDGFAKGAPGHHHLVFKAHPLEIGRLPLRRIIARMAAEQGIAARVHFVRGGKLAPLLDQARSAVTVNSTAAQQALWRGIPLRAFGTAVFEKPEFVSDQPLPDFFANPRRPNAGAYRDYRRFLLETSQVPGGFYSSRGRRQLLREVVDMMLSDVDPYDALQMDAPRQPLKIVS